MASRRQRTALFSLAGLLSLAGVLAASTGLGLPCWVRGTVLCRTGAELVNASGTELQKFLGYVRYGLFNGERVKQCGLGGRALSFKFFPDLQEAIPAGLHVTVIFFCGAVILFSSVATGFFFYNAFGRPSETLHGPLGLYLWDLLCGVSSLMVLLLFSVEVKHQGLSGRVANHQEGAYVYATVGERYQAGYLLYLGVLLLHAASALLVRLAGAPLPRLPALTARGKMEGQGGTELMY